MIDWRYGIALVSAGHEYSHAIEWPPKSSAQQGFRLHVNGGFSSLTREGLFHLHRRLKLQLSYSFQAQANCLVGIGPIVNPAQD
jgi:hypothetical protein